MADKTTDHFEPNAVESYFQPDDLVSKTTLKYITEIFLYSVGFFILNAILIYVLRGLGFFLLFPIGLIEMYVIIKILFRNVDRMIQTRIDQQRME